MSYDADASVRETETARAAPGEATVAWVMSYFEPNQDLASDSLHLAYSRDGLNWFALAPGRAAYQLSGLGSNHIRDPFLFRKSDGTFLYIATDWTLAQNDANYWNRPSSRVFMADSADLITFTNPRLVRVTSLSGPNGTAMHAWAPEVYFDAARNQHAIIWSGNDTTDRNHIYASYTTNFTSIVNATPTVFFSPGYNVIDATIVSNGSRNFLFYKDESDNNGGAATGSGKDIQIARSPNTALTAGSFVRWDPDYITRNSAQGTRQATEGPLVVRIPNQNRWYMYADFYLNGGVFGCWTTTDLNSDPSTWTRLGAHQYQLPPGVRHANTVRVTQKELDALIARYGVSSRIRTTYSEGGVPFHVGHSWYHGMITPLDDTASGQLARDFEWKVVPGLANPSDPNLVSFESVGHPGRYLRVDSANPNRYPACNEASNRGNALCWVPAADRHHLSWVDTNDGTATFRNDATFRRVAALNGNTSMVSLQWYVDGARYLRHASYQLFAATNDASATQRNDASFTIER